MKYRKRGGNEKQKERKKWKKGRHQTSDRMRQNALKR
jgi:hypothetical protein